MAVQLALQGSDSTIATTPRTLAPPNLPRIRPDRPPAPELVMMADDLAKPPWKLDARDAKRSQRRKCRFMRLTAV
jgi:hypothetical protein